jgi:hypothetical protein
MSNFSDRARQRARAQQKPKDKGKPKGGAETTPPWEEFIRFDAEYQCPAFPVNALPEWLRVWVVAEAEATQTPPDLTAMLSLATAGAGLAKKYKVIIRPGWAEPTNIYTVTALPPGERKTTVFAAVMAPIQQYEREEQARMAPIIAAQESTRRTMEAKLKHLEGKAAKETDEAAAHELKSEAKKLARDLAAFRVDEPPQMYVDDVTPERLGQLLARHGGRMLQAAPEGTAFEIAKGRYSESANFDVYLKAHAGDPLRTGRISREDDIVDEPALSLALAVQPDVITGLAEQATMRGRGFLARFWYSLPTSKAGQRKIAAAPVPKNIAQDFHDKMLAMWRLAGTVSEDGRPAPILLQFARGADQAMREFETWLEPQLAPEAELSYLAGWANKLAGAIARLAAILHVADAIGQNEPVQPVIDQETVEAAIRIGRGYLLPHAQAAFGLMGANRLIEDARHVVKWLRAQCEVSECSESTPPCFSRREIHQGTRTRQRFSTVEDLDPVLDLLVKHGHIRPLGSDGQAGRGHKSPVYEVNKELWPPAKNTDPCTHNSHCTHTSHSESSECSPRLSQAEDSEVL